MFTMTVHQFPEQPSVDLGTVLEPYKATQPPTRGEDVRLAEVIKRTAEVECRQTDWAIQSRVVDALYFLVAEGVERSVRYLELASDSCHFPSRTWAAEVLALFQNPAPTTEGA